MYRCKTVCVVIVMINKKRRLFEDKRIVFFISVMGIFIVSFWFAASLTEWESTKTSIFRWQHWFFMDWFGELHRIQTGIYTGDDIANYPAFCFLIFKFFYSFIPEHDGQVYDDFTIRATQPAVVPFFILMTILIFAFYHIFRYQLRNKTIFEREGMAIVLLLSAPYVCLFERGNLITISLVCTFLYLMLYDSDSKELRLLSYVCLSVASAIKIYPALFGILTLLKKRNLETVLLIFMGASTFFLPFFAFGGLNAFQAFLNSIIKSFNLYPDEYGFGYDFSIYNFERMLLSLFKGYQIEATNVSRIVITLCLIIAFLFSNDSWKKFCVLSLAIVFLPKFSYFYTVCFLAMPLLYLLQTPAKKIHYLYLCEFLLIYVPYINISIDKINYITGEEASHLLGLGHIFMYIGLISLLFTLIVDGVISRIPRYKKTKVIDLSPLRSLRFFFLFCKL